MVMPHMTISVFAAHRGILGNKIKIIITAYSMTVVSLPNH